MRTPQIEPITSMQRGHKTLLGKLSKGPVFLTQRSRPAAVLLSVGDYEKMVIRLEQFELLAAAKRINAEMDATPIKEIPWEEAKRRLAAKATA